MIEQLSTFIRRGFFTPIRELEPQPRKHIMGKGWPHHGGSGRMVGMHQGHPHGGLKLFFPQGVDHIPPLEIVRQNESTTMVWLSLVSRQVKHNAQSEPRYARPPTVSRRDIAHWDQ